MPIAKEQITIGTTVVANPGNYVSKAAVKQYGWQKLVDDGPDLGGDSLDSAKPENPQADVTPPKKAAKAS